VPGRETKLSIKNDKNMRKNMTKNHRFWGHVGTHFEGFEKGPLHDTYTPDPLFSTCWTCVSFWEARVNF